MRAAEGRFANCYSIVKRRAFQTMTANTDEENPQENAVSAFHLAT